MIKAIIFDMDGLLIDSEPIWQEAEGTVLGNLGVRFAPPELRQTMGLKVTEVVQFWYARQPWENLSIEKTATDIMDTVVSLVKSKGTAMPGVRHALDVCKETGLPMAIASGSFFRVIEAVLEKLGIKNEFSVIYSAEHEPYGKPHPGVYITAANKLDVAPECCLAFEDSPNGVLSAKAARMKCVTVPDVHVKSDKRFLIADLRLASLDELTIEQLSSL